MSTTSTLTRRLAAALAAAALVGGAALAQPAVADAAPATTSTVTSASLLQFEDLQAAGLAVDGSQLGTRGDQLLGDAGRVDEGCLGEKTMRNITNAKAYPAPGTATAYVDGRWDSTLDKDVFASESVAEGRTSAATDRYTSTLKSLIVHTKDCQQDPAQGHSYSGPHTVTVGTATATYYYDITSDGSRDGGGAAVVRDGNRFGYVNLMFGSSPATLKKLATAAAANLR